MHIIFTLADLRVGGAETNAVNLARLLQDRGHRVTVVAGKGPLDAELHQHGIRHIPQNMRLKRPWTLPATALAIVRLDRTDPVDVVHAFMASGAVPAAIARAISPGTRYGIVAAPPGFRDRNEPPFLSRLRLRLFAAGADAVIAPSTTFLKELRGVGVPESRLRLLPFNATLIERFDPAVVAPAVRAELGLGPDDLVVASIARLNPTKGQDLVLRAAPDVIRAVPSVRFLFVGDGPWRGHLEELARSLGIEHAVRFAGERSDVPEILRASSLVVQTTFGFGGPGLAVIEAFAAGVPVVGMSFPDLEEAIAGSGGALTVAHGDSEALASAVIQVLGDPERAREMGRRARAHAMSHFDMRQVASRLESIYEEVGRGSGG